ALPKAPVDVSRGAWKACRLPARATAVAHGHVAVAVHLNDYDYDYDHGNGNGASSPSMARQRQRDVPSNGITARTPEGPCRGGTPG
ncbi:MAG TPA: hypothetical protein VN883_16795, partial [Myxococcales bacterium]|nr:hypothetical protein [Myxococcales bacterium]